MNYAHDLGLTYLRRTENELIATSERLNELHREKAQLDQRIQEAEIHHNRATAAHIACRTSYRDSCRKAKKEMST